MTNDDSIIYSPHRIRVTAEEPFVKRGSSMCYEYPIRTNPMFMAQVVVPLDLTAAEARRLCAFIQATAMPELPDAALRSESDG